MNISFAPLQGFTDAAYRRFHHEIYGDCIDFYYTPFIRLEHGTPHQRDIRDIDPKKNAGFNLIPQIICSNATELDSIVPHIINAGYNHIDINMGCPFPLQTRKHRGSGILTQHQMVNDIIGHIVNYSDVTFSVKMRLGYDNPQQCIDLLPILNHANLSHITMHPRLGIQQYRGEPDMESFKKFHKECNVPIIFNGDITSIEDINNLVMQFPDLHGIMIGRGLLSRPSLAMEYKTGITLTHEQQLSHVCDFHSLLYDYYATTLQGEAQILCKIKPFWEYLQSLIGKKNFKAIKKASTTAKYLAAIKSIDL